MEITVTDNTFKSEVLESNIPVIIDFWAPWCGPCKMIAPVIEQIAKEYSGKIKVCKVNVDENSGIASQYSIMSIPTVLIVKDGEVVDQSIGAVSLDAIREKVNQFI